MPAPKLEIKDVKYIESNGNGSINPGERIEVLINVRNTGNAIAENVEVELIKIVLLRLNQLIQLR